jgi:hypothetical protein
MATPGEHKMDRSSIEKIAEFLRVPIPDATRMIAAKPTRTIIVPEKTYAQLKAMAGESTVEQYLIELADKLESGEAPEFIGPAVIHDNEIDQPGKSNPRHPKMAQP